MQTLLHGILQQVANDDVYVIDSNPIANSDSGWAFDSSRYYGLRGQSFACEKTTDLTSIEIQAKKYGSPTGTVYMYLYAHSGVYGTSSVGTGSPLATATYNVANLPTDFETIKFTFGTPYELQAGTKYVWVASFTGGDSSNGMTVTYQYTGTHSGNNVLRIGTSGSWDYSSTRDGTFVAYSE